MSWKIISGALTIMGALCVLWVANDVRTGVANRRGYAWIWSEDPQGFWCTIAIDLVVIALFFFGAFKAWRQSQREPKF